MFPVTVSDRRGAGFKGMLIQARRPRDSEPVGTWQQVPANLKPIKCSNANDAVTHSNPDVKKSVTLEWLPMFDYGEIQFKFELFYIYLVLTYILN